MSNPRRSCRRLVQVAALSFLLLCGAQRSSQAQALPTATGPGERWIVGGTYSYFQADYGKRYLAGGSGFVDFGRSRRFSYEAEVRYLTINQEVGTHQSTYLVGLKYPYRRRHFTLYGKLLVGEGRFHFPYGYADGSYFVIAPGGGIDVPLGRSRYSFRAADVEYQNWVNFPFGILRPYGFSSGIAISLHRPSEE